ncbi:hypothetical protein BVY00_02680 [bacterium G20]|nr:hypothetical protein BVY00_02680 [bacterium G20]
MRGTTDGYAEPITYGQTLAERIIWFAAGILLTLLAFRFVLSLLGANRGNGFANFIYDASHPFIAPFFNLFNYNIVDYGVARVEIYTLFAMAVYAFVAWILAELVTIGRRDY